MASICGLWNTICPFAVSPTSIPLKREDSFFFFFRVRLESVRRRLSALGQRILTERMLYRHENDQIQFIAFSVM